VVFVAAAVLAVALLHLHRRHVERAQRNSLQGEVARGPRVQVVRVERSAGHRKVSLPGDVRGYSQATVYAKLSGYVREVLVDRGDRVQQGQLLATIESPETAADARAAQQSAAIAGVTARRYEGLAPAGVVSAQERDNIDAQQRISQATLGRERALLQYTQVHAPFAGTVTARYVDPGALVPAATGSTQSALPIVDLASVDTLRVLVYVGQDVAPFVKPGDHAEVWQDELPERRIPATVTRTAGGLELRTRTMQVEVDVDNRSWGMLPGTFAHVEIAIDEPPSVRLPTDALAIREGQTKVARIEDERVRYASIDVGYNDGKVVRVLRGLEGGETVALDPPAYLMDGDRVQVQREEDAGPGQ
jgi:RND family efflux transporter MFP subunit